MRALICEGPGQVALREVPVPTAAEGEVIVRVASALTCGTDLKMIRRGHAKVPFPVVLGHEFAGVVERVGERARFEPGDRVCSAVTGPCGRCSLCLSGKENLCRTAFDRPLWGAFAEYVRVPERVVARGLRHVPPGVSFEAAALLDPLASVLHGLSRLPVRAIGTLLVYGSGPIAFLFTWLARRAGIERVLVAGRRPGRLATVAAQGAEPIDLGTANVRAAVREVTLGQGVDAVVETTGDSGIAADALELVGRGGALLLFAGAPRDAEVRFSAARVHYDEVSVVGSFHYTPDEADRALDLIAAGNLPVSALVSDTSPLEGYEAVFRRLARGEGMKTAFLP